MARPPRIDYPGAWHHVMNRGARRADVFLTDAHCVLFLDVLAETVAKTGVEVHAYSLMPNHFHLLVRSPDGNLSDAVKRLVGSYTQRLNRLCGWDGAVFRGRFRNKIVEDQDYLRYLFAYVHLNPVRAGLLGRVDEEHGWTSHRAHLGLDRAPEWLSRDGVERVFGSASAMGAAIASLHDGRAPWPAGMVHDEDVPRWVDAAPGEEDRVAAVLAHVREVTGASAADLQRAVRGRGANPARRFAVTALDDHTDLQHAEIGAALGMSRSEVANVLYRHRKATADPFPEWREELSRALARSDARSD